MHSPARNFLVATLLLACASAAWGQEAYDPGRFEKEILATGCKDALSLDVLPDGRILFIERAGAVKMVQKSGKTTHLGNVPALVFGEVGLLGFAADQNFLTNGHAYFFFCPADNKNVFRLARFTIANDRLDEKSQKTVLEFKIDADGAIHLGGGVARDRDGNICIGVGDNCPPIAEVPTDIRPGKLLSDAFRTAGNSKDLRGSVLRIHPEPDGTYTIPKGNLFPDGKEGRPEIFAMGCRNPYRLSIDYKTNWIYFGDVGPNIGPEIGTGPEGYDEVNQARVAGNYGWPQFTGPNEAFRRYDFATKKPGEFWDLNKPINPSPNNTGLKVLPKPIPAMIWYPTGPSKEFPELGAGGRSIMVGPITYYEESLNSAIKLPKHFDRTLLIYDWMRNWIKTVHLDGDAKVAKIEPFLPNVAFRKPMDIKTGPDGALYMIEYGDRWSDNVDGEVVRLVYRRGNRPPVVRATATPNAGKHPLTVTLDGSKTFDKDAGDTLKFAWSLADGTPLGTEAKLTHRFEKLGSQRVRLAVTDSHGSASTAEIDVHVGNTPPVVTFAEPKHGGFFDWNDPLEYRVEASDAEDGSTKAGSIPSEKVTVQAKYVLRGDANESSEMHPGFSLMKKTTCFACHASSDQAKGPPYAMVAKKYHQDKEAREKLAKKIISGGLGAWGNYPMPPHPQHTLDETRLMVDWVLSLASGHDTGPIPGISGGFRALAKPGPGMSHGSYLLTARYADQGASGTKPTWKTPSVLGEATVLLHARRKMAAFPDLHQGMEVVHELDVDHFIQEGMVAHFKANAWIAFKSVNLHGIDRLRISAATVGTGARSVEVRLDSPNGPRIGGHVFSAGKTGFTNETVPIETAEGLHDLYVIVKGEGTGTVLRMAAVEFLDSPSHAQKRALGRAEANRRVTAAEERFKAKPFVRIWTADDLAPHLAELDQKRSSARGMELFKSLACATCHRLGNEGASAGPDLSDVLKRLSQKHPNPRLAMLSEILDPSKNIDAKYQTKVVLTDNGLILTGIIVEEDEKKVIMVGTDPSRPEQRREIPRDHIDAIRTTKISMMPQGLLNTLTRDEILDLLAVIEANQKK